MRVRTRLIPWALAGALALAIPAAGAGARAHPKRGVASARYLAKAPSKLSNLGATWAYDWSASAPPRQAGPAWVPMIWGSGSLGAGTLDSLRSAARAGRIRYLLGFNEPDSGSQANLSPERAASLWPQLERTGLTLGSPAPAVPTDGWLGRFMALVRSRHMRVDFLALHYYQDFTNPDAVAELRRQLVSLHDEFGKPIWITEIGAIDIRSWGEPMMHTPTEALATAYMRKLFSMLDSLAFVQRYAWFTDECWSSRDCRFGSLYNSRGRLTPAGRAFQTAP